MAPKAGGREIQLEGLPPGWKCVEKTYLSGAHAGNQYMRFFSDKHKNVLSLKAAIKLHAEDMGLDPEQAMIEYERKKEEKKEEAARLREERGLLKGEKRQEAIDHFRSVHGKLDGATVVNFPGWKGESKVLENCGQVCATYYDPDGRVFKLLNDIEAFLGTKILAGQEIPDIDLARSQIIYDDKGRPVNTARRENCEDLETQAKKRKLVQQEVGAEHYREESGLTVVQVHGAGANKAKGAVSAKGREAAAAAAAEVRELLLGRGFEGDMGLLAVVVVSSEGDAVTETLTGTYFQMEEGFNDRPCYQRVLKCPGKPGALACRGVYIFWSKKRDSWKIGALDDAKVGYAFCPEDKPVPTDLEKPWSILKLPSKPDV